MVWLELRCMLSFCQSTTVDSSQHGHFWHPARVGVWPPSFWYWVEAPGPSWRIVLVARREEAEYTAHLCFVLVVACSHWAAQRGFAVLRIQRMPPIADDRRLAPTVYTWLQSVSWMGHASSGRFFFGFAYHLSLPCPRACARCLVSWVGYSLRCHLCPAWSFFPTFASYSMGMPMSSWTGCFSTQGCPPVSAALAWQCYTWPACQSGESQTCMCLPSSWVLSRGCTRRYLS